MVYSRSRSKYNNKRTLVDGIVFDSKKEANRYLELKLLERSGHISDLGLQPKFPHMVNGIKTFTYIADFKYLERGRTVKTVEDVKGFKTPMYKLKKRIIEADYQFKIKET